MKVPFEVSVHRSPETVFKAKVQVRSLVEGTGRKCGQIKSLKLKVGELEQELDPRLDTEILISVAMVEVDAELL